MTLYTIDPQFLQLLSQDELTDADIELLDQLSSDERRKITILAAYIQNIKVDLAGVLDAKSNMDKRAKRLANKIKDLTDIIQMKMELMNINCIDDSPFFEVKLNKKPPHVEVYCEDDLPEDYWRKTESLSINKEKIAEDIKNLGLVIPGAKLVSDNKIVIK